MFNKRSITTTILFAVILSRQAYAVELELICEEKSDRAILYRKFSPTLGIDIYAIDPEELTVKQLAGELLDNQSCQ